MDGKIGSLFCTSVLHGDEPFGILPPPIHATSIRHVVQGHMSNTIGYQLCLHGKLAGKFGRQKPIIQEYYLLDKPDLHQPQHLVSEKNKLGSRTLSHTEVTCTVQTDWHRWHLSC